MANSVPSIPLQPDASDENRAESTQNFLAGVQGGILSTAARGDHVAVLLFEFSNPAAIAANARAVRATAELVTDALQQYRDGRWRRRWWQWARKRPPFRSLVLTGDGLTACGALRTDAAGNIFDGAGRYMDTAHPLHPVWFGMVNDAESWLGDSLHDWEAHFKESIAGAWILGEASADQLNDLVDQTAEWCRQQGLTPIAVGPGQAPAERGFVWRDKLGRPREPFGFVDGISVQRFFRNDSQALPSDLNRVFLLTPDEYFGSSFLVLRKLEQNVRMFRKYAVEQGQLAAEQLVGRHQNGAPLAPGPKGGSNDFDFNNDQAGKLCPFHAHIRRSNPRKVKDTEQPEIHLVRRGVVFGSREDLQSPDGVTGGVGLLFMAYMSAIESFRTIQGTWFNSTSFPLVLLDNEQRDGVMHGPPKPWRSAQPGTIADWVTARGGAYFFVPSLQWLRELAEPPVEGPGPTGTSPGPP